MNYKKSNKTRKTILETAIKLFKEKGFEETSIRNIAKEANTSTTLIYYYFPNGKYGVGQLLVSEHMNHCIQCLRSYIDKDDYLVYLLVLIRFRFREIRQNEEDFMCYYNVWNEYYTKQAMEIEHHTASLNMGIDINIDALDKAFIVSDSVWHGMYRATLSGQKFFTDKEIRDTTDIVRWSIIGLDKETIEAAIERAEQILSEIPLHNIRLLRDDLLSSKY